MLFQQDVVHDAIPSSLRNIAIAGETAILMFFKVSLSI